MKVIRESGGEHGDCLMSYIDFESTVLGFSEDITLFWGYQTPFNKELISKHKDDKHNTNTLQDYILQTIKVIWYT